ncbi:hypothetical protein KH5H1_69240 [Corallococcus caeni]|uniref:Uncharacterized protein n=1 Tax=Corallococcus caeni TaxID=3082388 RepID=A0ABQ6R456_9BACT|nr:hypothetical protein KH5H1_69240 [Corallococcus sp. KH5-1]GMU10649.1 hypothetical protein ASNO1_69030 [Corallococcus sp. NO1]
MAGDFGAGSWEGAVAVFWGAADVRRRKASETGRTKVDVDTRILEGTWRVSGARWKSQGPPRAERGNAARGAQLGRHAPVPRLGNARPGTYAIFQEEEDVRAFFKEILRSVKAGSEHCDPRVM